MTSSEGAPSPVMIVRPSTPASPLAPSLPWAPSLPAAPSWPFRPSLPFTPFLPAAPLAPATPSTFHLTRRSPPLHLYADDDTRRIDPSLLSTQAFMTVLVSAGAAMAAAPKPIEPAATTPVMPAMMSLRLGTGVPSPDRVSGHLCLSPEISGRGGPYGRGYRTVPFRHVAPGVGATFR